MKYKTIFKGLLLADCIVAYGVFLRYTGSQDSFYLTVLMGYLNIIFVGLTVISLIHLEEKGSIYFLSCILSVILGKIYLALFDGTDWLLGEDIKVTTFMIWPFGLLLWCLLLEIYFTFAGIILKVRQKNIPVNYQASTITLVATLCLWFALVCL